MIEGMKKANVRDCAGIMRYFAWLEEELRKPDSDVSEYDGAMKLTEFKKEGSEGLWIQRSFPSISSIGSNGAVIHYCP